MTVSIRDLLSWVRFINATARTLDDQKHDDEKRHLLEPAAAYIHGACMVFLDALGAGTTSSVGGAWDSLRDSALAYLQKQTTTLLGSPVSDHDLGLLTADSTPQPMDSVESDSFGIHPFCIPKGKDGQGIPTGPHTSPPHPTPPPQP